LSLLVAVREVSKALGAVAVEVLVDSAQMLWVKHLVVGHLLKPH
jgi:hypothetical protein